MANSFVTSIGCTASIDSMFIQDCIAITVLFEFVSGWPTLQTNTRIYQYQ